MQEGQSSSSGAESAEVMSICKSEPLFSPVKEVVPFPANTVSVDSLDCQSFDDQVCYLRFRFNIDINISGTSMFLNNDLYCSKR